VRAWSERILGWIAPNRCPGCGAVTNEPWCAECGPPEAAREDVTVEGVSVIALGVYEGPLARAIRRFKYEPCPALAQSLARPLAARLSALPVEDGTVLVPVPLHRQRLVERGFNQAALIARELARATHLPLRAHALVRAKRTDRQATLKRALRFENVLGAFALRSAVTNRVILVDDVVTTGATARACIAALRAGNVAVSAIAALAVRPAGS